MGTLAGGIAHDFNNLLMGIQGRTSLMMMNDDFSRVHYEDLKGIEAIVRSGVDLTKQLLGFGRKGKVELGAVILTGWPVCRRRSQPTEGRRVGKLLAPVLQKGGWGVCLGVLLSSDEVSIVVFTWSKWRRRVTGGGFVESSQLFEKNLEG